MDRHGQFWPGTLRSGAVGQGRLGPEWLRESRPGESGLGLVRQARR